MDLVTTALLIMIKLEKKNFSWENAKKMMAKVDAFKEQLEEYRGEDVPEVSVANPSSRAKALERQRAALKAFYSVGIFTNTKIWISHVSISSGQSSPVLIFAIVGALRGENKVGLDSSWLVKRCSVLLTDTLRYTMRPNNMGQRNLRRSSRECSHFSWSRTSPTP